MKGEAAGGRAGYLSGRWRRAHMLAGSEVQTGGSAPDAAMTSPSFGGSTGPAER